MTPALRPLARCLCLLVTTLLLATPAWSIPALQLGPGAGAWVYDPIEETWQTDDDPLQLLATANATNADGGNGRYAWTVPGSPQYAYLVVAAVPKTAETEPPSLFDITVENDGGALALTSFGNGAPPLSDPNSLPGHGIFDTYFELYEFEFDGPLGLISDTQPGETGTGQGFTELFDIAILSLADGVEQLHFDLFTVEGGAPLGPGSQVAAFAPFSHDAETGVPEPGAGLLLAVGLAGLAWRGRSAR